MFNNQNKIKIQPLLPWLLLAISLVTLLRLLPIFKSPLSTYGYDYGFYLYAINHTQGVRLHDFYTAILGGYNNPLFVISHLLHIPSAVTLNELYFLAFLATPLACFWFFYPKNPRAGILAVILCASSLVQAESYSMFLWKSAIALPFLILALKFLYEKKYFPLILVSLVIIATHRTTAIIYLLTLITYALIQQIKQRAWKWIFGELVLLAILAVALWPSIQHWFLTIISSQNTSVQEGVFYEGHSIWSLVLAYAVLGACGLAYAIKKKEHLLLGLFFVISLGWMIFHLVFYKRIAIYVDIASLLLAAYFLEAMIFDSIHKKIILRCGLVIYIVTAIIFTVSQQPLITNQEVVEIQNFSQPSGMVVAASAVDGPWLLGNLHEQRLTAPGLFEDTHTYQQWLNVWQGGDPMTFFAPFPRPLYIYERSYQLPQTNCFKKISENFYQYTCK